MPPLYLYLSVNQVPGDVDLPPLQEAQFDSLTEDEDPFKHIVDAVREKTRDLQAKQAEEEQTTDVTAPMDIDQ